MKTEQLTIFDFQTEIKEVKETRKQTCRQCIFRYKHQYGKMFYCSKQTDVRTSYGHKKIKAGDVACNLFKQKVK